MTTQKLILSILALLLVMTFIPFVSAAISMTSPLVNGNYTSPLTATCTKLAADQPINATNATIYYNASGGRAFVNTASPTLTTIVNDTVDDTTFTASVDITSLTDLRTYNFTCVFANRSTQYQTSQTNPVSIDNTDPAVATKIEDDSFTVGGIFRYTTTMSDDTTGVQTSSCTVTDPEGTATSASIPASSGAFDSNRLANKGIWTLSCTVTDYATNSNTASSTITADPIGRVIVNNPQPTNNKDMTIILVIVGAIIVLWLYNKR